MNANLNIMEALGQIAREKNVDPEMVIETLSDALVSAARKRYGNADNFEVQIDPDSGHMTVLARKTVVEEVNEPELEIDVDAAQVIDNQAQLGSVVFEELNLAVGGPREHGVAACADAHEVERPVEPWLDRERRRKTGILGQGRQNRGYQLIGVQAGRSQHGRCTDMVMTHAAT